MQNDRNLAVITFMKGYAILTIVLFHLFQNTGIDSVVGKAIAFGGTGVHTFFLLSGFGLYLSHCRHPLSVTAFIKKRFAKVYVPYLGVVLLSALLAGFIPIFEQDAYALLGHIFLYKMFDDRIIGSYGYHLWFVSTIIQFYIAFPALVWLKQRVSDTAFLLLTLAASGLWIAVVLALEKEGVRAWYSFFLQYVWEFGVGMLLAQRYIQYGTLRLPSLKVLGGLALLGLTVYSLMTLYWGSFGKMINDGPGLVGYTAVGLFIYRLRLAWIQRFLLFTGIISYALYLVHIAVKLTSKYVLAYYGWPLNALSLFIILLLSYLIAYYYHRWVVNTNVSRKSLVGLLTLKST